MPSEKLPLLRIVGMAAIICIIFIVFVGYVFFNLFKTPAGNFASLAALVLVGLAAFIAIMNILSVSSYWIGITNPAQPFGLPEGTVRAILTLSFIVLVGVLSSFLLTSPAGRSNFTEGGVVLAQGLTLDAATAQAKEQSARLQTSDGIVVARKDEKSGTEAKPGADTKSDT